MKKSEIWLAILASIGVGAATFYKMAKDNDSVQQTMENILPSLSNTLSDESQKDKQNSDTQSLGPHGMS